MSARRSPGPPRPRIVFDSGGLTALCGRSTRARGWLRQLAARSAVFVVPTPVLVESTTGDAGRDAEVNRVLGVLERSARALTAPDEATARRAGELRHRAGTDDGIDALVAAAALATPGPCVLLTSDPRDLERLLAAHADVLIVAV